MSAVFTIMEENKPIMSELENFFFQDGYSDGFFSDSSNYENILRTIFILDNDTVPFDFYIKGLKAGIKDAGVIVK